MKTDSIFYQLFQSFPSIFFELIGQPNAQASRYEFKSVEIKQTAFRIDGVFLPESDAPEQLIYFVEVQFQQDTNFYYRFFTEIFLFLGQNKPKKDWRAVAVFSRRSIDSEVPVEYQRLLASQQIQWVYLDELGETANQFLGLGIVQLVVEPEATAGEQARRLIRQARQEFEDETLWQEIVDLISTIMFYKFPSLIRQEVEEMFGLSDLKQTRVYQEAKEEGREEGRLEAKLESVPRLLAIGLSVEQVAEVLGLEVAVVQQVAQEKTEN